MRIIGGFIGSIALAGGLAVAAPAAQATPAGDQVVIAEAYLNGGSAGATYLNKYVELHNPTDHDIDVSGWSIQYRSATSTSAFTGVIPLGDHHIPAGGRLLVSGNANAANGAALPTPDVTSTVAFSGSAGGTLALAKSTAALTGAADVVKASPNLVDLVGYGTSTTSEGAAVPSGWSVTASIARASAGTDTDVNAADFTAGAPTPQACGEACDPEVEEPPTPTTVAIDEIQGTGAASPLTGQSVTTRGIVTAAYPTGGFNGVYLQTAGTGNVDPATHVASDGIFVFGSQIAAAVHVGDHLEVTGTVVEFNGLTELSFPSWTVLAEPAEAVKAAQVAFPLDANQRERLEGMLVEPQGDYVVTNNFNANNFAEIGLASGTRPLDTPTNVARPGSAEYHAVIASNEKRKVTLDDGASLNFLSGANQGTPLPWLRPDNEVRVGAPVAFTAPLILDYRNNTWKLQPTSQLTAAGAEPVTFGNTREAAPQDVGGTLTVGTFNVLNYFTMLGEDYVANGLGTCSYYKDRFGVNVTNNTCSNNGPRGAANAASFARQEAKIVAAINALDADVVSLEEVENSAAFGIDRDTALRSLVEALNEDAGAGTWDYVRSPAALPAVEDVIRTAFIHRTASVEPIGESSILDDPAFANARQPLAQEFRPTAGDAGDDFVVIANHFKSKGSGEGVDADQGDGQGASNHSRVLQATALVAFADDFSEAAETPSVFLAGDFNAYDLEDPVQVIEEAGYTNVTNELTDDETYNFDGQIGSLDHVFASPAAWAKVTGADVWNINAYESVAREYSRYNYNATLFHDDSPFRSSDHDPELVGIDAVAESVASTLEVTGYVRAKGDVPAQLTVAVHADGAVIIDGTVTVRDGDGRVLGTAEVVDGVATVALAGNAKKLKIAYGGGIDTLASSTTYTTK